MNELIKIESRELAGSTVQTVNARYLHHFLGVAKDFSSWIKAQIERARLVDGRDYLLTQKGEQLPSGTKWLKDYHLTLDAGKHVAMMSGTDKGFEVREYFLECERHSKALAPKPPAELSRMDLIQIAMDAERERLVLADRVAALEPQAAVAERISTARGSFCIRDAAKSLQVRPIDLTNRMLAAQWIYKRPGRRGYVPYGAKLQQLLLEVKQVPIGEDDNGHERLEEQVRITAKGLTRLAAELGRPMVQ